MVVRGGWGERRKGGGRCRGVEDDVGCSLLKWEK